MQTLWGALTRGATGCRLDPKDGGQKSGSPFALPQQWRQSEQQFALPDRADSKPGARPQDNCHPGTTRAGWFPARPPTQFAQGHGQARRTLAESLLEVIARGLIKTTHGKRAALHDILINNDACKEYIESGELEGIESIMSRSSFDGMQTANQSLMAVVKQGRVAGETAQVESLKANELAQALRAKESI